MEATREVAGNERRFLLECLQHGHRADHRAPHQTRRVEVQLGDHLGTCSVALGKTRASCAVSYNLVEPGIDTPNLGIVEFHVTLAPLAEASWLRPTGRYHPLNLSVTNAVERAVRGSGALDPALLVVVPGKCVGSLRVDVTVLHNDGNAVDCCVLAAVCALRHFRRPEVSVKEGVITVHAERDPIPFSLQHMPVSVTCAIVGKHMVVDPTLHEAAVLGSYVSVAINARGELCGLEKIGGAAISRTMLQRCVNRSRAKAIRWLTHISKVIGEDEKGRKMKFREQFEWAKQRSGVGLQPIVVSSEIAAVARYVDDDCADDDDASDAADAGSEEADVDPKKKGGDVGADDVDDDADSLDEEL
eukprot:PhM_4_TR18325/c0_g1_i1/m.61521/K03678/RRP45, EXOSC9; exosome complex component RRP45